MEERSQTSTKTKATRRRFGLEFDDRVPNDEEQQLDSAVEMLHKSFNPTPNRFSGRDFVEELIFSKDSQLAWDARCTIERNNKAITVSSYWMSKCLEWEFVDWSYRPTLATWTEQVGFSVMELQKFLKGKLAEIIE
ncbi:hypothetical protein F2Q68_00017014 [Brassica cretica]|uniref:Uncharacterized protein n=1 Tax=Brassica cretica TaxID=69181 RepID=A0A8S9HKY1_BRACR|nr:hypothetical protein F2Q68_00017014 [Brassica cretica]